MGIDRQQHVLRPGATYATVEQVARGKASRSLQLEGIDDAGRAFKLTVTTSDWRALEEGRRFMDGQS